MKEVVFTKEKSIIRVLSQKQTFLHGKDNTFRSNNPDITKRLNKISDKNDKKSMERASTTRALTHGVNL